MLCFPSPCSKTIPSQSTFSQLAGGSVACVCVCEGGPNGMVGGIHTLMASQWMCGTVGLVAWGTWEVSLGQGERTLFSHRQDLSYREGELKGSFGASWCLEVGTVMTLPGQ